MTDLLEELATQDARINPTTSSPDVRDTKTGESWPKYDRCPDCEVMAWGVLYPTHENAHRRTTHRIREGWLTLAMCNCGRLRWRALDLRDGDYWLHRAPATWGPIVPRPNDEAWMRGDA